MLGILLLTLVFKHLGLLLTLFREIRVDLKKRRLVDLDRDPSVIVSFGADDPHDQTVDGQGDETDHGDQEGDVR
jgi:hypothetical protein